MQGGSTGSTDGSTEDTGRYGRMEKVIALGDHSSPLKGRGFSRLPPASIARRFTLGQDTLREGSIRALRHGERIAERAALYPPTERSGFRVPEDKWA